MQNKTKIFIQKFGGTSIGIPSNVRNIQIVINENSDKQIIVLSAFTKVTDLLIDIVNNLKNLNYDDALKLLSNLHNIHFEWIVQLSNSQYQKDKLIAQLDQLTEQIRSIIQGIRIINEVSDNVEKRIIAFGEILSTSLFYILISDQDKNIAFLNAFEIIEKNDTNININSDIINELLEENDIIITQGFICLENGKISNLGRGGSDYSAALIGAAISAHQINIWTDVDGILTASPKIFNQTESLDFISFTQIRELAKYGAKVLHVDTILPAIENDINVKILNTSNLKFQGTLISKTRATKKFSISMLNNISIIQIERTDDEEYFNKILKSIKNITLNKLNLLEVISNIDNTQIYYTKQDKQSNYSIICIVNPDIKLISEVIKDFDYVYNSSDKTLKIFLSSDISEKLLNLIYEKLKLSLNK